jgi:hypothetical protein
LGGSRNKGLPFGSNRIKGLGIAQGIGGKHPEIQPITRPARRNQPFIAYHYILLVSLGKAYHIGEVVVLTYREGRSRLNEHLGKLLTESGTLTGILVYIWSLVNFDGGCGICQKVQKQAAQ